MKKEISIDSSALINPDFSTSTYYDKQPMTEDELVSKLENDYAIYRKFIRYGFIISREFSFITRSTFDDTMASELDYKYHGAKTPEQKEQAIKMCKVVERHFNSFDSENPVEIAFASRSDSECALYDMNRFDSDKINNKLIEAFM